MSHRREINTILQQAQEWSPEERHALAIELLRSAAWPALPPPPRETLSLAKAVAASMTRPPPTDEDVRQWIAERRAAKYGGGVR